MRHIFIRRKNDFEIIELMQSSNNEIKTSSLIKKEGDFLSTREVEQFGGSRGTAGPHVKASKNKLSGEEKIYFVSTRHDEREYFAMEILNLIGFNTPKVRLLTDGSRLKTTSKAIDGYLPIGAFIHNPSDKESDMLNIIDKDKKLRTIHQQYKLDMDKQVIIDLYKKVTYKISGNLFATNLAAYLLQDKDFQPEEFNVGLVKIGNRFFAHLIDKEGVIISGSSFQDKIAKTDERVSNSKLYLSTTDDQVLFILYELKRSLDNNNFSKIFQNPRVQASKNINKEDLAIWEKDIIATAYDAIAFFIDKKFANNKNVLDEFHEREKIRSELAEIVTHQLDFKFSEEEKQAIKEVIKEDLRASYYKDLFANKNIISHDDLKNNELIRKLIEDQKKELSINQEINKKNEEFILKIEDFIKNKNEIFVSVKKIKDFNNILMLIKDNRNASNLIEEIDKIILSYNKGFENQLKIDWMVFKYQQKNTLDKIGYQAPIEIEKKNVSLLNKMKSSLFKKYKEPERNLDETKKPAPHTKK